MSTSAHEERLLNSAYLSLFLINLIVSASFYMVSTTMSLYVTKYGATAAAAGTVVGVLSIASMCIRPFSGMLSDRLNRKRLMVLSLAGISVAMAGCGLTRSIPLLIALRVLHGVCFSLSTTVIMALVAGSMPQSRMTQGLGYFAVGQTITSAFAPSLGILLGEHFDYSVTFISAAALVLLAAILAVFIVPAQDHRRPEPFTKLSVSDFISKEALPYGILAIVVAGATGVENGFVALYGKQLGLGNVGWYFTAGAIALFISRMGGGKLADRRTSLVMYLGLGLMAAAFVLLGFCNAANGVVLFAAAAILKALGLGAVQPTLQASSMKSVSLDRRGAASSTYYLGTDIGQAFAPIAGGFMAYFSGYSRMFFLFALPQVLGACFYYFLKRRKAHPGKESEYDGTASHNA